jgi:hypothetical protein
MPERLRQEPVAVQRGLAVLMNGSHLGARTCLRAALRWHKSRDAFLVGMAVLLTADEHGLASFSLLTF